MLYLPWHIFAHGLGHEVVPIVHRRLVHRKRRLLLAHRLARPPFASVREHGFAPIQQHPQSTRTQRTFLALACLWDNPDLDL